MESQEDILRSVVGDIENFSTVTLDGSAAGAVSNFETAKLFLWAYAPKWNIIIMSVLIQLLMEK